MKIDNLIRTSFLTGVGLLTSSTQQTQRVDIKDVKISTDRIPINLTIPTSTRFNDSKRYSLEKLLFNKQKLESLKALQKNWDGYEAEKISDEAIQMAELIISKLEYQPQIFPTGRGSIQIEKYFNDNNFYEIEISDNEIFLYKVKNGIEEEKEISESDLVKNIIDFYV